MPVCRALLLHKQLNKVTGQKKDVKLVYTGGQKRNEQRKVLLYVIKWLYLKLSTDFFLHFKYHLKF